MGGARKYVGGPGLSIPELLNEAQRASSSGHLRYAKVMWELVAENPTSTLNQLVLGTKLFMASSEKNIYQERILRYMATFTSEVGTPEQLVFIEAYLAHLVELSYAKDNNARWRACQMIHCVMCSIPADADLSDEVADAVQDAMLGRLEDARPNVRSAAVRALARLPMPDDEGNFTHCPVTMAMIDLLSSEKSKEVRKAVLASLPDAPLTRGILLDRTRDESDDVRRVTYLAIAEKVRLQEINSQGGALLIRRGLGDRTQSVSEAATAMVTAWLDGACQGEPLALLRALDVENHPTEAESAIKALVASNRLNAVQVANLAAEEGLGLRADFASGELALMGSEEALFWRVICEHLSSEATSKGLAAASTAGAAATIEAAAAGDRLEALEAALPAGADEMVGILAAHARGGAVHRFACAQLVALTAKCMDFTDAMARRAAGSFVEEVLLASPQMDDVTCKPDTKTEECLRDAMGLLIRKVHAAPAELAEAMLNIMGSLHAAGRFETSEAGWLHALQAVALMLESLPNARVTNNADNGFTLADTLHQLIQPALGHDAPEVRAEAVRCLGLYCLLDGIPTQLASHLPVLRSCFASSVEHSTVRLVAAQALGDLALQRGPKTLDAMSAAQASTALAVDNDGDMGMDPLVASEPTVDLLLSVLSQWQATFADVASQPRGRGRQPRCPEDIEAAAKLGTAIVEGLVRLVAVNEYRQTVDSRRNEVSALEDGEVLRLLVTLLVLNFDPTTEPASHLRQCLTVFFERYASLSVASQQYLATAALPTARSAVAADIAAGRKTATSAPIAPQVLKFMLQLLQLPVVGQDGQTELLGHEPLAELVLGEVLGCARRAKVPKPYLSALCKVPLALPMYDAGEETRQTMLRIQVYAAAAARSLSDRTMKKDMEATFQRYAVQGVDTAQLAEEEVVVLLQSVASTLEAFCSGFPMPFENEDDCAENATTRRRGSKVAAHDDDDSEDSDDCGAAPAPAPRSRSTRAGRPSKTLAESSESEEEQARVEKAPAAGLQAASSDEEEEEEESSSDEDSQDEDEWHDAGEENVQRGSAAKYRRASNASVEALRVALAENARIS